MKINRMLIFNIFIAFVAFIQLQPYFLWNTRFVKYIYAILAFIIGCFLILLKDIKITKESFFLCIFAIFITIYLNYSNTKIVILNLIFSIPLFFYLLMTKENKQKTYYYFTYIFAIALIPGILMYCVHIFGIDFNWTYLEPLNSLKTESGIYYQQYFGSIVLINPHSLQTGNLYRLCGMFDEPGVIGTISALILVGNRYRLKNSYINKILFLGGLLSFSLFFYIITISYYLGSSIVDKNYKRIIVCMVFIIGFSFFNTGLSQNEFISDNVLNRLSFQDGKLKGDNRNTLYFEAIFDNYLKNGGESVIFGMGHGTSSENRQIEASASWKKFIYDNGFLGLTLIILFLFVSTLILNRKKEGIILLLVMFSCIYQRPGIFDLPNLIIFLGGLILLSNSSDSCIDVIVSQNF